MAEPDSRADAGRGPAALVAAGDEELRVLLRGLLRLFRCRVVGEVGRSTEALARVRSERPDLLLVDCELDDGSTDRLVADARRAAPALRIVLLAPVHGPPAAALAGTADVVLRRPFRIHQFAEAIGAPADDGGTAGPAR